MRIRALHIDGFGLFRDVTVTGLPPGLVVLLGDNEAGKSTCLGFVRAVLFGFPDGRTGENRYEPLAGGRHGGSLTVESASGEVFVVHRGPGPRGGSLDVRFADGSPAGADELERLLGGATRELYRTVFAFGLDELQQLGSLQGDAVAGAVYAASAGAGARALVAAEKWLAQATTDRFRKGGQKPAINRLIRQLRDVRAELRNARDELDAYAGLGDELAGIEDRLDELRRRREALGAALARAETDAALWGPWQELCRLRAELGRVDAPERFPDRGVERLEVLRERRAQLDGRLVRLDRDRDRANRRLGELDGDDGVLAQAEAVRWLVERRQGYLEAVRARDEAARRARDADRSLDGELGRLGPGWDEPRVARVEGTVPARAAVHRHREVAAAARARHGRAVEEAERLASELAEVEADRAAVKDRTAALRDALAEAGERVRHLERAAAEVRRRTALDAERAALAAAPDPPAVPAWVPLVVAAAGLAVGGALWPSAGPGTAGGAAGALVLVAVAVWWGGRRAGRDGSFRGRRRAELEDQIRVCDEAALAALAAAREDAAGTDGVERLLAEAASRLDRVKEELVRTGQQGDDLARRARLLLARREEAEAEAARAAQALEAARGGWHRWLAEAGLPGDLEPEDVPAVLDGIDGCRRFLDERQRFLDEASARDGEVAEYRRRMADCLRALGRPVPAGADPPDLVAGLAGELERARARAVERAGLEKRLAELDAERGEVTADLAAADAELDGLLAEAGADTPDALLALHRRWDDRRKLADRVSAAAEQVLALAAGTDLSGVGARLAALGPVDADGLRARVAALRDELDRVDADRSRLEQERGRLLARREQLAGSDGVARLRLEEERVLALLEEEAAAWRRYALARRLLVLARERFEQDQQPAVVRRAAGFLRTFTAGAYDGIVAPLGSRSIEVLAPDGRRKAPAALSRGTAEQLYLAVRFGYIGNHGDRGEPLPVVMDDVLVNFDPTRARNAVRAVLELARSHQVLFFTCHPATVDLFRAQEPAVPVYAVGSGGIRPAGGERPGLNP